MKSAGFKLRVKALAIDYICICIYLIVLFAFAMGTYLLFFNGIPEFTEIQSQWIALLTSVLPITIYFTTKEAIKPFGSFGKKKAGLKVEYLGNPVAGSIIRNALKFLPWQFGHMAVIRGIYEGFDSYFVMTFYSLAVLLPVIYIVMVLLRKDHRHIPDLFAKSKVVISEEKTTVFNVKLNDKQERVNPMSINEMTIELDRASVCMGDDCVSHNTKRNFDKNIAKIDFLQELSKYVVKMNNVIWAVITRDSTSKVIGYIIMDGCGEVTIEFEGRNEPLKDLFVNKADIRIFCKYYHERSFSWIDGRTNQPVEKYSECRTLLEKVKMDCNK